MQIRVFFFAFFTSIMINDALLAAGADLGLKQLVWIFIAWEATLDLPVINLQNSVQCK